MQSCRVPYLISILWLTILSKYLMERHHPFPPEIYILHFITLLFLSTFPRCPRIPFEVTLSRTSSNIAGSKISETFASTTLFSEIGTVFPCDENSVFSGCTSRSDHALYEGVNIIFWRWNLLLNVLFRCSDIPRTDTQFYLLRVGMQWFFLHQNE